MGARQILTMAFPKGAPELDDTTIPCSSMRTQPSAWQHLYLYVLYLAASPFLLAIIADSTNQHFVRFGLKNSQIAIAHDIELDHALSRSLSELDPPAPPSPPPPSRSSRRFNV